MIVQLMMKKEVCCSAEFISTVVESHALLQMAS